jgi:ubiquinone/menaquinone biosynthesis C-methylase UbiE
MPTMKVRRKSVRRRGQRPGPEGHIRHNRAVWDRVSTWYDRRYRAVLGGRHAAAWGVFRVPESELRLLGTVRGKWVLELGCGAARWSIALARRGARPTGLDLSSSQLAKARELQHRAGVRFPLVRASAERLPFAEAAFDLVFCDWGAMTFSDPTRSVPECARVLRAGGELVFATASPLRHVAFDIPKDRQVRRLVRPYFGIHRVEWGGNDSAVEFHPPYGVWIDLFRRNGLAVERLVETRPAPGQRSTYLSKRDAEWSRSWPLETIWKLRKE